MGYGLWAVACLFRWPNALWERILRIDASGTLGRWEEP